MYTYDEVYGATLEYFKGDELATKVWIDKYALRNTDGDLLEKTPTNMHWRLAKEFARVEKSKFKKPFTEKEIFDLLDHFKYIVLQGSPMYGIGNPYQYVSLSNCYVIPSPQDSLLGIKYTDSQITQIACRRGGAGWDISTLRPKNTRVKNAANTTSGAVSFAKEYSESIRTVCQSGRRGASLQSMSVYHPEILDFIKIKRNLNELTGSNISVKLPHKFMQAVLDDTDFDLQWPVSSKTPSIIQKVKARDIWGEFVYSAWLSAEPGCAFIDTVHEYSTSAPYGYIEEASNPCFEQCLPAYGCCRLLLQNLYSYVNKPFTTEASFNYELFKQHNIALQRIGDDLVDLDIEKIQRILDKISQDKEPKHIKDVAIRLWQNILKLTKIDRRIGCGLTGIGDCLAALNITYGSPESIEIIDKIMRAFTSNIYAASVQIAKELGPFSRYNKNKDKKSKFIQQLSLDNPSLIKEMEKYGRRNMALLTMSPAGSVSLLTQTTSGIEPCFQLEYKRRKKIVGTEQDKKIDNIDNLGDAWQEFDVQHPKLKEWKFVTNNDDITKSPWYKCCAKDINWQDRINVQATIQKYVDNSISSTINLPSATTVEEIEQIYLTAWQRGLKGITIYRDGCRDGVLVNKNSNTNERPKELPCDVHHVSVKGQSYFVLVGLLNNSPFEIFAGKNGSIEPLIKTGKIIRKKKGFYKFESDDTELSPITSFSNETEEAITRLVSTSLRAKVDLNLIVTQLEKVGGASGEIHGFAKGLARILKKYTKDGTKIEGESCPSCQSSLVRKEGCWSCEKGCGYTKCT